MKRSTCASRPRTLSGLDGVKHADDSLDRLTGVDRVQSAEDEMAGLGRLQRDLHRLAIAQFADQDYLG